MKARLVLLAALAAAVLALAGCGGSGSSSTDLATLAPPQVPLYVEGTLQPEGETKTNIEALVESIAGIDDLGGMIVSELEKSGAEDDEPVDFDKEVQPWLGEKAAVSAQTYNGEDFNDYGVAVETTDADAAQAFIEKQADQEHEPPADGTYEGVDYKISSDDGQTVGIIGDTVAFAESEADFKKMIDASNGESLADEDSFASAIAATPSGSAADVFVDIGALIEGSGGNIDPDAQQFLDSAGIDPGEATAVASLVPGSDSIEIDISTDLSQENASSGDASTMLGSLPAGSVAAFASAEFGKRFEEAIDNVDAKGIPDQVPPHKLKSTLKEAGVDLEKIAASIGDIGVFAEGNTKNNLAGAIVLSAKSSSEATNTVANLGLFLRAAGTSGVTAISGKASGFSIRDPDLGNKPLVVAAQGERIAIAYGLPAAAEALATDSDQTLAEDPAFKEAVSALGSTPISAFADGPAALELATGLVPKSDEGFREARPYLTHLTYAAIGAGTSGDLATAKLILGVAK